MHHINGGEIVKIETNEANINKLFGNDFWFVVPEYQRPYLWERDNVNDLLNDLWDVYKEYHENDEDKYFLGSLVLCKRNEEENGIRYAVYDIVDGQQRLTTLMLLMAVLRDVTKDEQVKKELGDLIYQKESRVRRIPERVKIKYKRCILFLSILIFQSNNQQSMQNLGQKPTPIQYLTMFSI